MLFGDIAVELLHVPRRKVCVRCKYTMRNDTKEKRIFKSICTMKKLFLFCMLALATMGAVNAQEKQEEATERAHGPRIMFAEREHNYGTIQKGGDGNCAFTYTNTGGNKKQPNIIPTPLPPR